MKKQTEVSVMLSRDEVKEALIEWVRNKDKGLPGVTSRVDFVLFDGKQQTENQAKVIFILNEDVEVK